MAIQRVSSLERLMANLSYLDNIDQDIVNDSVSSVASWWKKRRAMVKIRADIVSKFNDLECALNTIHKIQSGNITFMQGQQLLSDPVFGVSVNNFLCCLPRDVSLVLSPSH